MNQTPKRLHPLVAGAAASVMLVSLVGTAAITGILPSSHGTVAPAAATPVMSSAAPGGLAQSPTSVPVAAAAPSASSTVPYSGPQHIAHRTRAVHHMTTAQAEPTDYVPVHQVPMHEQPARVARNSPVGIGVGAVIGGLIGSQVGGGNGRTLATIAGVVGGGYVGNEIAKRNQ